MDAEPEKELFPDLDAAGALRAAFKRRDSPSEDSRRAAVARLADRAERRGYDRLGEIARGGMGVIVKAFDRGLERDVALKVLRDELAREPRFVSRFLEEAQVTGNLEHPSIVPVHELGLDGEGRVFFTMKLVMGRDLQAIFELVFRGEEGWNETRALSVILKVCEAMAYAHEKGVIHRDLKPANVMVGDFGEVYVMDWGLARVSGRRDTHDIRLRSEATASAIDGEQRDESTRSAQGKPTADSPLVTMDGDVVGTPAYMPPEQARGEIEELGPHSDVYAIGAMLYHLLARQMPYVEPGESTNNRAVLRRVQEGPPKALSDLRRDVTAELVAITERAMERDRARRYRDMTALAEDLRAYLEHRVVKAYQTGAFAELRKWVERNKALAAASAAAVLALACGLVASLILKGASDRNAQLAQDNADMAQSHAQQAQREKERAEENAALATARADDVLRLSALQDLDDLSAEANRLWPPHPEMGPRYEAWLVRAQAALDELPAHEARLLELRDKALPGTAERVAALAAPQTDALESEWDFADTQDRWWHNQLTKLVERLKALSDPQGGLFSSGVSPEHGWGVRKRLEFASTIEERTVSGSDARSRWSEALASIRDETECPLYGGLVLEPQIGLLPLGRDPDSGLWEFAHLQTGEPALRSPDGKLVLEERTGVVLVLVPGGTFRLGAQSVDPSGANYDPDAVDEDPVHEVTLSPFFLSKYEMTQGQWTHATASDPSMFGRWNYDRSWNAEGLRWSALHPVERVSWTECSERLARADLELPTEAQWEYGCRAGTSSVFWAGDEPMALADVANLSDSFARFHGGENLTVWEDWLDDGQTLHGPVGPRRANAFGLHDVHGNVWEWCRDWYAPYSEATRSGDGERSATVRIHRVYRGGSFSTAAVHARSAFRLLAEPDYAIDNLGVRPARAVSPR